MMYERKLTVLPSDASCRGHIKLHSLLNYLQDTAALAVSDLEGTTSQLMARGYAWVLTRYEVELLAPLPVLDEPFVIGTYHDPSHGYGTLRVFQVSRPDGTPLVWAKTSWLLLDLASGRPVRPLHHLPQITLRDTQPIDPDFKDIPDFPEGFPDSLSLAWPVRFHDLDSNGHVNNAVYFEWIFEATPVELMGWDLRSVSASFRSGARWGEKLRIQVAEMPFAEVPDAAAAKETKFFVYRIVNDSRKKIEPEEERREKAGKPMTAFACLWERSRP